MMKKILNKTHRGYNNWIRYNCKIIPLEEDCILYLCNRLFLFDVTEQGIIAATCSYSHRMGT